MSTLEDRRRQKHDEAFYEEQERNKLRIVCTCCGRNRLVKFFYVQTSSPTGFAYYCKDCQRGFSKEYYESNKVEILDKQIAYYVENKEYISKRKKEYYKENAEALKIQKKQYRERNRAKIKDRRAIKQLIVKLYLWAYKKLHPCVDCGETRPYALQFDHIDDTTKKASVGAMYASGLQSVIAEVEKCEVVCSNCHRRRTAESRGWYLGIYSSNPSHRKRIERNRAYREEYLSTHPCIDCGETDTNVLDFDHKNKKKKLAPVAVLIRRNRLAIVKEEIFKCHVRCANCHALKTAKQRGYHKKLDKLVKDFDDTSENLNRLLVNLEALTERTEDFSVFRELLPKKFCDEVEKKIIKTRTRRF